MNLNKNDIEAKLNTIIQANPKAMALAITIVAVALTLKWIVEPILAYLLNDGWAKELTIGMAILFGVCAVYVFFNSAEHSDPLGLRDELRRNRKDS
jgi:hypothetical protein